jgi:hypothetical protein
MNAPDGLRLIAEPQRPPTPEPKVLVRTLTVPPGLPWDQNRAAQLEAMHSAPLPMADIVHQLQRLEGWRPGAAGRFAAFYVLARDLSGRLDAKVEVGDRTVAVSFLTPALQRDRARGVLIVLGTVGVAAVLATLSVGSAFLRRAEAEAALSALETRASGKLHAAELRQRLRDQSRALDGELGRGGSLREALGDLAWASAAKAPDAHIEGFHWQPGLLAVEVRGATAPFESSEDRTARKSPKPLRRGVWLWGVTARPTNPAMPAPLSNPFDAKGGRP